jgi:hypothetical protein
MGSIKAKIVSDEVAVKRMDALSGSESKRPEGNEFIGAWAPGSNGDRPGNAIKRGGKLLAFKEEKKGAEVCAIDPSNEVGKILGVRFNSREDIKGVLRSTKVLSESGAEKV